MEIPANGLTFTGAVAGPADGPAVLLLHGFPQTHHCWAEVTPRLHRAGARTIAYDQRGYSPGARPAEVSAYAVGHLVADAVGVLDSLGIDRAHIVGHDWGAIVAWYLAVRHPERAHSLTALSVPHPSAFAWAREHDADQQARSTYISLFQETGKAEDVLLEHDAARLRAGYRPLSAEQAAPHLAVLGQRAALTGGLNWYRAMDPAMAGLGPCTVPTTYLWSTGDTALGRAGAERCAEHVTGPYRFVEIPEVSHWIPEQEPALVAAEIGRHLNG
ncbi:pimeloyl-ACP methyl ester carboxylesterase [Crossiella equi]|uniref:Pimeloyl-ACP methyl ester carboxylesterase n=1 Tax=Crossiella equi TaxID=130796 RepID=A0ABS5A8D5_9PSEU|nr:alpha/beta fold hydrolase [Crossiella equi]MBP2472859.1 pimeloyl-ACP methyl ester carboxylesterase [Crossiella equi]